MKKICLLIMAVLTLILLCWFAYNSRHLFVSVAKVEPHQVDQDPNKVDIEQDTITKGNPEDSARALIELVPDSAALLNHYDTLILIAESTTGEMNPEILKSACVGISRSHASALCDKDRTMAIMQWISWKIWETKNPQDKQRLVERFAADAQRLIASGKLPAISGLESVLRSILSINVKSNPKVSLNAVVVLFEGQILNADQALRDYLWTRLIELGKVLPEEEMNQLYAFLKQNYTEKNFPLVPSKLFYPDTYGVNPGPGPVSSEEYDEIAYGTLNKLHHRLRQDQCKDPRSSTNYCVLAGERIIDEYLQNPSDATALVESLLSEGLLLNEFTTHVDIFSMLHGESVNVNGSVMPVPLLTSVLNAVGRNPSVLSSECLMVISGRMERWLTDLSKSNAEKTSSVVAELQTECFGTLLSLCVDSERRHVSGKLQTATSNFFLNMLNVHKKDLLPGAKFKVKAQVEDLLHKRPYKDLPGSSIKKLESVFKELCEMK